MEHGKTNDVEWHMKQYSVVWHCVIMCVIELAKITFRCLCLHKHTSMMLLKEDIGLFDFVVYNCHHL